MVLLMCVNVKMEVWKGWMVAWQGMRWRWVGMCCMNMNIARKHRKGWKNERWETLKWEHNTLVKHLQLPFWKKREELKEEEIIWYWETRRSTYKEMKRSNNKYHEEMSMECNSGQRLTQKYRIENYYKSWRYGVRGRSMQ